MIHLRQGYVWHEGWKGGKMKRVREIERIVEIFYVL